MSAVTEMQEVRVALGVSERRTTLLAQEKASLQRMLASYQQEQAIKSPAGMPCLLLFFVWVHVYPSATRYGL